jgi:hypothetical protein
MRARVAVLLAGLGVAFALLLATSDAAQSPTLPQKARFRLFLLVGQSNMAGRGEVTPADTRPHPRIMMLSRSGAWVPAADPMHFDKPDVVGDGLGRSFAIALAEADPSIVIGLIPAAVGGSPVDAWRPGVFYPPTRSHPWDDAIARARLAMPAGTLDGILWHQGESDATPELAPGYEAKLHDLIARFRAALEAPDVPFIAGQMGRFPDHPWDDARTEVDRAHRDLPGRVRHTAYVSAEGLAHKGDGVHFDAESYRVLGRRYAEAYTALRAPGR